jgi:hypothetical protein
MKKLIITAAIAAIFSINLFAQDVALASPSTVSKAYTKTAASNVNVKVARSFVKNFGNAENVNWKEKDDEFVAEFNLDGRLVMAWFKKTGNLYCANYYGTAKHLHDQQKELIEESFKGYAVVAATEVVVKGKSAWIVTLQNDRYVRKVRIADGDLEEVEVWYRGN